MTEPGFPDFQARQTFRGTPVIPFSNYTFGPAGTTFGPVPVNSFSGVEVHLLPGSQGMVLTVYLSSDNTTVDALVVASWAVPAGMHLDCVIPAVGDFVIINVASVSGSGTCLAYAAPVVSDYGGYRFTSPNPELMKTNVAVPISGTSLFPLPAFTAGQAVAWVNPRDNSAMLTFNLFELFGTGLVGKKIAGLGSPAAQTLTPVMLPASAAGLQVVNNDATAAHSFDTAIIPQLAA